MKYSLKIMLNLLELLLIAHAPNIVISGGDFTVQQLKYVEILRWPH